jgi:hypothetical protein
LISNCILKYQREKRVLLCDKKCRRRDLSPRPFDYESNALTKLSYPGKLSSISIRQLKENKYII